MRIAVVARDLNFGIGIHTVQLRKRLEERGLDVDIYVGKGNLRTNIISSSLTRYDLIHVQGSCFGAFGNKRIPMVTTVHSLLKTEWKYEKSVSLILGRLFENLTLKKSQRIIVVNETLKEELQTLYQKAVEGKEIHLVPNAIDVSEFDKYPDAERNLVFVMSCGRQVVRKGFKYLRDACKKVRVPLKIFHGELPRSELIEQYKKATIFVSSSLYESFGFSVAEAMACKCPVICSDIPSFQGLVSDGKTGLLFQPANVSDLCDKMRLLLDDEQLRLSLAENAYEHIRVNFGWDNVVDKTLELYKELL